MYIGKHNRYPDLFPSFKLFYFYVFFIFSFLLVILFIYISNVILLPSPAPHPSMKLLLHQLTYPLLPQHPSIPPNLGNLVSTGPRASPSIDGRYGNLLLHMLLEHVYAFLVGLVPWSSGDPVS